ncbi:MAG: response regulator transcription factor [Mycobacteriaceae bacterium]|nr:response regulator transcription factor [Mycobacteriaceae bacterium]MBV9639121.1 response regulator transcription factor [Mycobacteriaceae bacterium]
MSASAPRPLGAGLLRRHLVLVERDPAIASVLVEDAAAVGLETTWCRDGAEALLAVGAEPPAVLIVAAATETVEAASIAAAVRARSELPILVGAAGGEEELARQALATGASAVIARPYDVAAILPFLAKVRGDDDGALLVAGPIEVDRNGRETRVRGRDVQLTQRELELLIFLIERRGRVASSAEISRAVWGRPSGTNTVAVHVKRLREKLGDDREHGEFIRTIRGAGYRLAPSVCS